MTASMNSQAPILKEVYEKKVRGQMSENKSLPPWLNKAKAGKPNEANPKFEARKKIAAQRLEKMKGGKQ